MNPFWSYADTYTLKGALFGSGQVTRYHMRAWKSIKNVEIVAVANRTVEKAHQLADEFGIDKKRIYASHEALLSNEEIDFVDIATAPHVHYQQVIDAAVRRVHILCQKPFSTDITTAEEMINRAERAGILLSVNENWRWRSWYRALKRLLDQEVIDHPRYLYIRRHNNATLNTNDNNAPALLVKQPYTADLEKLLLFEWGIHIIDVTRFLFGEAECVYTSTLKVSTQFKGEDRAVIIFDYADRHAVLDLSWSSVSHEEDVSLLEQVIIEGDGGCIKILPDEDQNIHISTREGCQGIPAYTYSESEEYQMSYTRAQNNFIECLRTGCYPETHAQDNLKTLTALFAAYQSSEMKTSCRLKGDDCSK